MIPWVAEAGKVVRRGGVIGIPTDTVYGIGVDPLNGEAVARLFELKGRPAAKPVGILAGTLSQAEMIGEIIGLASELAVAHWPGALTLVVRPLVILADWVGDMQRNTVGIRIPDHSIALELLEATGPLTVTSANLSGGADALSDGEARAVFGDAVHYVPGTSPGGLPSTVVDVTGDRPVVIREGPVVIRGL